MTGPGGAPPRCVSAVSWHLISAPAASAWPAGNSLLRQASALRTIAAEGDARFAAIAKLITEWQPDALVVGVPFHPDGAAARQHPRAQRFARQLHGRFGLPVHEVDERYSTTEALAAGAPTDAAAAAIILDSFCANLPDERRCSA
jgi:putative Holliday junction resolvase